MATLDIFPRVAISPHMFLIPNRDKTTNRDSKVFQFVRSECGWWSHTEQHLCSWPNFILMWCLWPPTTPAQKALSSLLITFNGCYIMRTTDFIPVLLRNENQRWSIKCRQFLTKQNTQKVLPLSNCGMFIVLGRLGKLCTAYPPFLVQNKRYIVNNKFKHENPFCSTLF